MQCDRENKMNEFVFPLRVYIEDTDYLGIVFYANYLKYFERARSEWAEQQNMGMDWQIAQDIYITVRSVTIDYLKPARLHQMVEVVSRIKEVKKASYSYDQHLRLAGQKDTILCKAETKVACVDKNMRPQVLPKTILAILRNSITET